MALRQFGFAVLLAVLMACQPNDASLDRIATAPATVPAETFTTGVDFTCRTDADCRIKDIGSCCGYYPTCVNTDSPTFPERVSVLCSESGLSDVCGFPAIQQCQCVENRCEALLDAALPATPSIR